MTDGADVGDPEGEYCGSAVGERVGAVLERTTLGRATADS